MSLLEIEDLSINVLTDDDETALVEHLSLSLNAGETLCIVGESGSGKTVSALSIIRLLEFVSVVRTSGRIRLDEIDLNELTPEQMRGFRGNQIGMIFQEAQDSLNPCQRIGTQLREAYHPTHPSGDSSRKAQADNRARELLTEVGLTDTDRIMGLYPHQLSGGMQQRVMIAMALMSGPSLLLADEPTTALDVTTQAEILSLFRSVQQEHEMACVFITHDMGVAAEIADRIAVLYASRLVEVGTAHDILTSPQHRYTRALMECVPKLGARHQAGLPTIHGSVPNPGDSLPGCRFAPRCEHAIARCQTEEPALDGHPDAPTLTACWNPGTGPVELTVDHSKEDSHQGAAQPPTSLLTFDHVSKRFASRTRRKSGLLGIRRREYVTAVDDLSLALTPGEFFGLVGESGSGKTTLGRMVAALDDPTSGTITLDTHEHTSSGPGGDMPAFRRKVQFIFQDPQSSLDPRHTVRRIIGEPLRELTTLRGTELERRIAGLLEEVGLPSTLMDRVPGQLSGGQRQRVAIARAIAPEPQLIVADEPTSALDVSVQGQVINLLLDIRRQRDLGFLFITHNLNLILSIADRVGVMKDGRLIEVEPPERIANSPQHDYTRTLLAANPGLSASSVTSR